MSKDFSGLSELLLGQAQPAQFQSGSQTGYWWGTKVSDDGNFTALDAIAHNANAEMPRGYHDGNNTYGDYYNWYAATVESGTFAQTSGNAADSICPSGWQLPVNGDSTVDKSWEGLLFGHYTTDGSTPLASNSASVLAMKSIPLSIPFSGYYSWTSGALNDRGSGGYFWSSSAHSNGTNAYRLVFNGSSVYPQANGNKVYGFTVRCVRR